MKTIYTLLAALLVTTGLFAQTTVTIYEIQGQTASSPYDGQVVTTSGIITGISYNGYYIQDGAGAWNGLFVYDSDNNPTLGDDITLTGEVQEYYGLTELGYISAFNVNSQGNTLPEPSIITALQAASEDYEGVLVKVENVVVTVMPDQYGIWTAEDTNGDELRVDDDMFSYTPTIGEELSLIGIMTYSYSEYKLNPRSMDDIIGGTSNEVTIYEIQGQAASSPYEGQVVTTSGIVTGITYNGYYIQDGEGAWNGILVFDNDNTPTLGDDVAVTGEVQEYYGLTELGYISAFNVNSSGNTLPEPANITAAQAATEDYEGVLVKVENVVVTVMPDQYGIWTAEDTNGDELRVDDDMFSYTPTIGEELSLIGIMTYSYSEYKLNPRSMDDIIGGTSNEITIYEIQGQAVSSPYEGQVVTTSGIVTGISFNGYYIQDGAGAWNGLFVFDNDNTPTLGDDITLTGEVQEYYDLTELGYISAFNVNSSGNTLPEPANITAAQAATEDYEGVLVKVENVEAIELPDQYGVWKCTDPVGDLLLVDDDMYAYTPTIGDHLTIVGPMTYSYSEYKLNPRSADDISAYNSITENTNVQISVFPNPATETLFVNTNENIAKVNIINQAGEVVIHQNNFNRNNIQLNVSGLASGSYFVQIIFSDNTFKTHKLSIK